MNKKIGLATCLSVFAVTAMALPGLAYKSAPMSVQGKTQAVVAKTVTKKNKKTKISFNRKAAPLISCGKK